MERQLRVAVRNLQRAIDEMKQAVGVRVLTKQERWRKRNPDKVRAINREYMRKRRASGQDKDNHAG